MEREPKWDLNELKDIDNKDLEQLNQMVEDDIKKEKEYGKKPEDPVYDLDELKRVHQKSACRLAIRISQGIR